EYSDQQALHARWQVLELVDEQRAVGGFLEQSRYLLPGRLLAAEQARLGVGVAQARGDERHERRGRARAVLVQGAPEGFAARARLADQHHRGRIARHLLRLRAQLLHELALAYGHRQRRAEQPPGLTVTPAGIERALDRAQQLREGQRLLDEVEGPEARRLH